MENNETGQCPCCGSNDVQQCDDGTFICMRCGATLCKQPMTSMKMEHQECPMFKEV